MAVSNVSVVSLKPGLSSISSQHSAFHSFGFCYNRNIFDLGELNSMSCSCIDNRGLLCCDSQLSTKQCNSVFAISLGRQDGFPCLLGHRFCSLQLKPRDQNSGFSYEQDMERQTLDFYDDVIYHRSSRSISWRPCLVKGEDFEGSSSSEINVVDEQTLERDLQMAIQEENYAKAAKIRDSLQILREDSKASVLAANARFYNCFRSGDLAAMQALWAKGEHACCVHPGASGISGYEFVMESWDFVWADYEFPLEIELKNVEVRVRGDVGYVTCIEVVKTKGSSWGRQFATNVFERIDGRWFICIHHASHVDL